MSLILEICVCIRCCAAQRACTQQNLDTWTMSNVGVSQVSTVSRAALVGVCWAHWQGLLTLKQLPVLSSLQ